MTDLDPSASSSLIPVSSAASSPRPLARSTVYGPAVFGTVRVDDPRALAELRAARAPAVPAAPPRAVASGQIEAAPVPTPTPRLAIAGAVLAVLMPPLGCVVSALALGRIVQGQPRPPGEALAAFGLALSVIAMTIAIAVAAS